MNRYIILLIIVIILGSVGAFFLVYPSLKTPIGGGISNQPTTLPNVPEPNAQTKEAVQLAFKNEIAPYDNDNTKLHETVIADQYALQVWIGDNFGGEALLKYDSTSGSWSVITDGGGAWSIDGLVQAGVPRTTATTLYAGVPH